MKKLIVLGLLGFAGLARTKMDSHSLSLNVGDEFSVNSESSYRLSCEGASGKVKYDVDGLPDGVKLIGDRIYVTSEAQAGRSIIRIRARDSSNQIDEQIVTLIIHGSISGGINTIGTGSSGTTDVTSTTIDQRFDSLINTYSSVSEKITQISYDSNRFPEIDFPEGSNPSTINTLSAKILNMQAQVSEENRNKITEQDIVLRTASERHQAAVKGITNLLTIIDQARANRNQAQSQLQIFVQAYNDALVLQRKAQNQIINAETKKTQIVSAIDGINVKIGDLKDQLADLDAERAELKAQRDIILGQITEEEKIKAELMGELEKINAELAGLIKQLNLARQRCQSIQNKIDLSEEELIKAKADLASITERRRTAETDVDRKEDIVNDLRRKLEEAERDLADAEIKLSDIIADETRLPIIIQEVERRLLKLEDDLIDCQLDVDRIQQLIDGLEDDNLTDRVREIEEIILSKRTEVISLDQRIAALTEPYEKLKNDLKRAEDDLVYLRSQITVAEENLRQAYINGNDANTAVQHARENLEAIDTRYQEEENIICEATLNLERARAEENLARLGLEELISHYSNALPYSIVPNGKLETEPGTPFGNNPSGSALGPLKREGDGAEGSFTINSWTHYLSQAFGSGVHPAFKDTVTKLFPFNFLSTVEGNKVTNSYGNLRNQMKGNEMCGGLGPVTSLTGRVLWVGKDSFKVRMNTGEEYYIDVNPCTEMNANVPHYSMSTGDETIFKGVKHSAHSISASRVTCLRNYY